jgi:hypothetical protein
MAEMPQQRLQSNEIAVAPETSDDAYTNRREHCLMSERFAGVDVREVSFDDR